MNTFEKIIEKIKNLFKENRQKLLEKGQQKNEQDSNNTTNTVSKKSNKLEYIKVSEPIIQQNINTNKSIEPEYEFGTIEDAIDQYLKGIAYNYQNGMDISSYAVLTSLFARSNQDKGQNEQNEKNLIDQIRKMPFKYYLAVQGTEKPVFYHIKSDRQEEYDDKNTIRLYINVKRENIAKLSEELIKAYGDDTFYFKFLADNQLDKRDRTESIVIYEKSENINRTLQLIEKLKQEKPQIFEDSEKMSNPFAKKILDDVVAYAHEVDGKYVDSNGKYRIVPASYNSVLSTALGESYINAAYELIKNNKDISKKLNKDFLLNIDFARNIPNAENGKRYDKRINEALSIFASVYQEIAEKHNDELVQKVKQNLLNIKSKNPELDINTKESKHNNVER